MTQRPAMPESKFCEVLNMNSCVQGPTIDKMDAKLDKVIDALSMIAVQKSDIEHLDKNVTSLRDWVRGHEDRLQVVEKEPGKIAGRFVWLLVGAMLTITSALVVYVATHWKG